MACFACFTGRVVGIDNEVALGLGRSTDLPPESTRGNTVAGPAVAKTLVEAPSATTPKGKARSAKDLDSARGSESGYQGETETESQPEDGERDLTTTSPCPSSPDESAPAGGFEHNGVTASQHSDGEEQASPQQDARGLQLLSVPEEVEADGLVAHSLPADPPSATPTPARATAVQELRSPLVSPAAACARLPSPSSPAAQRQPHQPHAPPAARAASSAAIPATGAASACSARGGGAASPAGSARIGGSSSRGYVVGGPGGDATPTSKPRPYADAHSPATPSLPLRGCADGVPQPSSGHLQERHVKGAAPTCHDATPSAAGQVACSGSAGGSGARRPATAAAAAASSPAPASSAPMQPRPGGRPGASPYGPAARPTTARAAPDYCSPAGRMGGGASASSARGNPFLPLYGPASLRGAHRTPPPPGMFSSASTRLALHDVLSHRSGAGRSRGGMSVTSMGRLDADFRPRWRF